MCRSVILLAATLPLSVPLYAYSVLAHEAVIDASWGGGIRPLLLEKFPNATAADLREARAYAYGGCVIQDMGYYPFGSHFFTDLTHYVRSGDFVLALLRDSQSLDEYAFSLGALAHYASDEEGHALAVNLSVPVEYRKLRRRYGNVVTYEDDPHAHLKVEFGFDVLQVAQGKYAPPDYHDFIGFKVSKPVLERAFQDTYGLHLTDVFSEVDLSIGTYRRVVSVIVPEMTKVAWDLNKKDLTQAQPRLTQRKFEYRLSRRNYRATFGKQYHPFGLGVLVLAFWLRLMPRIGPFQFFGFKAPTPETARFFTDSFTRTVAVYGRLLKRAGQPGFRLTDRNFDTGAPTRPVRYRMADDAYAKLARELAEHPAAVTPAVRANVLAYFRDPELPYATKKHRKSWRKTLAALQVLKSAGEASREAVPAK